MNKKFLEEVSCMFKLKSRFVVELYGIVMDEQRPLYGIVMELMHFGSILDIIFVSKQR